jgi:hypothetical protein
MIERATLNLDGFSLNLNQMINAFQRYNYQIGEYSSLLLEVKMERK